MSITAVTSPASIRSASVDDADAIFALVAQLGIGGVPERDSFDDAFAHSVKDAYDHILLVAVVDDVLVGYALATVARLLYTNGDAAQLQELVVDAAASNNGYGSQLVGAIERECESRGIRQLTVASILRGASFYERLNYRSTANYLKKSFLVD